MPVVFAAVVLFAGALIAVFPAAVFLAAVFPVGDVADVLFVAAFFAGATGEDLPAALFVGDFLTAELVSSG